MMFNGIILTRFNFSLVSRDCLSIDIDGEEHKLYSYNPSNYNLSVPND